MKLGRFILHGCKNTLHLCSNSRVQHKVHQSALVLTAWNDGRKLHCLHLNRWISWVNFMLQDLMLSQQCCWRFKSPGMCHCVSGLVVPNISKDHNALIFRAMQSKQNSYSSGLAHVDEGNTLLWNTGNNLSDTASHPKDPKLCTLY